MRLVWLLVGAACLIVAVGAALTKLPVPAAVSSAAAAVGVVVAGFWSTRAAAVLKSRDDRADSRAFLIRSGRRGRLPLVRELDDPVRLGVHPAATVDGVPRVPVFVRRDVMDRLTALISRDRFVLLVGESTAGKSRAAYEAVRALYPNHRLVEPSGRDGAAAAVQAVNECSRAVLWLDDIERFLGESGLTGAGVSSILGAKGGRRIIVATMRSEEYSYFCGGPATVVDPVRSREMIRQGWDVLRLATRVDLDRSWSRHEVSRAEEEGSRDPRIREALARASQFGIAEYLAAGPQLLARWRDAWAPGTRPRGAALVLAAIDARRAGIHRPLPLEVLIRAHEPYLLQRGGARLRPEQTEEAVTWATTPLRATSSLLIPSEDGSHIAFDYLIDAVEREAIPAEALEAFIEAATPEELMDVGRFAWSWSRLDQAELAYQRASDPESRSYQGYVIAERDGGEAHRQFLDRTVKGLAAELGSQHQETLDAEFSTAWNAGVGVNVRLSLRRLHLLLRRLHLLLPRLRSALGARHETTLLARRGIAHFYSELGEHRRSADLFLDLVVDCLENDVGDRIACLMMLAYAEQVGRVSTASRSVALLDELRVRFAEMRAPEDMHNTLRYRRAIQLLKAKDYERAIAEYQAIVADDESTSGKFNTRTVLVRLDLIDAIGELGPPERAVHLAEELVEEYRRSRSPHEHVLYFCRRSVAYWTGMCGREQEALRLLGDLRDEQAELGCSADRLTGLELRIRLWKAVALLRSGNEARGYEELRVLAEQVMIEEGQSYVDQLEIQRFLDESSGGRAEVRPPDRDD